ncbi:MAG: NADH-ubiquinone oxidoreductase-related protein, partial [uncultured Sphingomonas sp.]
DHRPHLRTRAQDDAVRQGQCRFLAAGVRAVGADATRPADRLERVGRHQPSGANEFPDAGRGDRLLREARPRLPRRAGAAGPAEAPGLRRQLPL